MSIVTPSGFTYAKGMLYHCSNKCDLMLKGKEWRCGCLECNRSWPLATVHTEITEAIAKAAEAMKEKAMPSSGLQLNYFVLTPTKDSAFGFASRAALRHYADCIEMTDRELAKDLNRWVDNIELALKRTT